MGFVYDTYEDAFKAWKRKANRFGYYIDELTDNSGVILGYVIEPCVDEDYVLAECK